MKILAITTIPSGVNQKKNGLRFLDATFCDNENVLEQYTSGVITLPADLVSDFDVNEDNEDSISYYDAAKNFMEFLDEIDAEYEDIVVVLNDDNGWLNTFLTSNGFRSIELNPSGNYRKIINYESWIVGMELDNPENVLKTEFEQSEELAETFLNKNEERKNYQKKIHSLITRDQEWDNYYAQFRECLLTAFILGAFVGCVFF